MQCMARLVGLDYNTYQHEILQHKRTELQLTQNYNTMVNDNPISFNFFLVHHLCQSNSYAHNYETSLQPHYIYWIEFSIL